MTRFCRLLSALVVAGCGDPLYLGSDVLWFADHESGDLADWELDDGGGSYVDAYENSTEHTVAASSTFAHSGRYSILLTRQEVSEDSGPGLFRDRELPRDAYYSAWYFVPVQVTTVSAWTIMKFRALNAGDQLGEGLDLNLRSLPGGDFVLYVFDHDNAYLQAPVADPPPIVRPGGWFHVEARFKVGAQPDGAVEVWLDGRKVYRLTNRTTVGAQGLYFTPCNIALDVEPSPTELYVDDAAISASRFTPDGFAPNE